MASTYLALAAYAAATTFSPGPNNILMLSSTSAFGFRRCVPLLLGVWTGLITVMLICGFACGLLGTVVPQLVPVAKYIGAAYVLYLAYKTLRRKTGSAEGGTDRPLTYVNGFLLQFLNVKILMLGIAAYSGYILPHGFHPTSSVCFACIMAACAATGNLIWSTVGTVLFPLYKKYDRAINVVMALLLLWCAWRILRT